MYEFLCCEWCLNVISKLNDIINYHEVDTDGLGYVDRRIHPILHLLQVIERDFLLPG